MAQQLPCDGEGICMLCKSKPSQEQTLVCNTCASDWHLACLHSPPNSTLQWDCPDCSPDSPIVAAAAAGGDSSDLIAAVRAIEADESLTEQEKANKRQKLLTKNKVVGEPDLDILDKKKKNLTSKIRDDVLDILDESFNCSFCMQLPERPVTTPCGHNFCLKCFQKWVGQGKRSCAKCRTDIPSKMASNPRINASLVCAIRLAKLSNTNCSERQLKVNQFVHNQQLPNEAFTTDRAKRNGKANACSGKIFVTVPPDHFGPIPAENDPERKQGVLVGESWEDRMECRQWGAHLPHVAGIAGQSEYGAQSVALSGGYEDDEDHGEWFLYTGSGGRDLSGNKRTNKSQSFDQMFDKMNEALRVSCKKGYPVRVVRSHKEKRSSYAPEKGVRYDGIYRIEKCWRKIGIQGYKVCRYLFVRCDNEPAPWTSDEHGDRPRPLPLIHELKAATDVTERKEKPSWDYDEEDGYWKWKKVPPLSRKSGNPEDRKRAREQAENLSVRERLLREFRCLLCVKVLNQPLTTPCAHNFCKTCLEDTFCGQTFVRERTCHGRRTLRAQKNVMKCPACPADISDFLKAPQVNRELMGVIESLQQCKTGEEAEDVTSEEESVGADEPSMVDDSEPVLKHSKIAVQNFPNTMQTYKRRKVSKVELEAAVIGGEDESRKLETVIGGKMPSPQCDGNESPSSPLHVRSEEDNDDDDFE
ncbi:RING-type E3 ubiquitin transferase [Ranunculus cassubicifolius]